MARGVNKWHGIGNLGQDPELKYTPSGKAVVNFSIGCSEVWKDKTTGEQQEKTEWVRIVLWGKSAEIAAEYLKKGSKVYIEGKLQTRKWTDNNGQDRYTTEIVGNEMQFLDSKPAQGGSQKPQQAQRYQEPVPADDFDDKIPF